MINTMNLFKWLFKLNRVWQSWNLRSFVLLSFILQCILILGSSLRIQTSNAVVHRTIWLVYLLADWAAYYAIGLILPSNTQHGYTYHIHSFWAPFLLLHIGGPNSIAGFALEDNDLWDRSVLHIMVQAGATAIIIYRAIPRNRLLVPTLLMFVAAFTRYVGRILALKRASTNAFVSYAKNAEKKLPRASSPSDELQRHAQVSMVIESYKRFRKHMGVYCGLSIKTDNDVAKSRKQLSRKLSTRSFTEMEIELNIAYDLFYTKFWTMIEDPVGRVLHAVSLSSEVGALVAWALMDNKRYQRLDVRLTNTLLIGGLVIDIASILKLVFSDPVIYHLVKLFPKSGALASILNTVLKARYRKSTRNWIVFRRWSGSIRQFNLLEYTTRRKSYGTVAKVRDKLVLWSTGFDQHVLTTRLDEGFKCQIFDKLRSRAMLWGSGGASTSTRKTGAKAEVSEGVFAAYVSEMYEAEYIPEIFKRLGAVHALLLWHTTTHRLYKGEARKGTNQRISEYLMYLLFRQPNKMILEGILEGGMTVEEMTSELERLEINDTRSAPQEERKADVERWRQLGESEGEQAGFFHELVSGAKDEKCISRLDRFVRELWRESLGGERELEEEMVYEVWIDFLMYAAIHCKARAHVRQLGEGGELLTVVWLMMTHLGITIVF